MTNLTLEVIQQMKESVKPTFYYVDDDSMPDNEVIVSRQTDISPEFHVLNTKTLNHIMTELPEYRFCHIRDYSIFTIHPPKTTIKTSFTTPLIHNKNLFRFDT